jgi:uncharacterized protein
MPHPVVHFEIGCKDSEKGLAAMIEAGGGPTGHITALGHEPDRYTIFYVEVEDVQAHLAKAESLGGKTLVPPVPIPTGTFAWLMDVAGNTVALWKPASK